MQQTTRLAGLLQERIHDTLSRHRDELAPLGPDATPLFDEITDFLRGGKRFRAQFAVLGYRSIRDVTLDDEIDDEFSSVLDAACALELFHAAALIHDDIIDRSDTRRGRAATHRKFANWHHEHTLRGDAAHFGSAAALLIGDLLQSWADELMQSACNGVDEARGRRTRAHFNRMRSEVAVGQYLDVLEEQQPVFAAHNEQLERSTRVLIYKSAKYSVEAPLLIGAALAGATDDAEDALSGFGLPIGVAFQLRDDILGVFGDEAVTGKPSGDDLIEGKRTVLAALARNALPPTQQRLFDELLGSDLTRDQVALLQRTIRDSGAIGEVEEMISRNVERATEALRSPTIRTETGHLLAQLAERATQRTS